MSTINDLPDYPAPKSSKGEKNISAKLPPALKGLEKTFATIPDAAWMADCDRRVLLANAAAGRLLGRVPADMEGRHCYEIVHASGRPIPDCPFEAARASKLRERLRFDEGGKSLEGTVYPVLDKAGSFIAGVHTLKDNHCGNNSEAAAHGPADKKK